MKLYDTHCHLMVEPLLTINDLVLNTAIEKKIFMNVVGFDLVSSKQAIEYAANYEFIKACVAIHPNDVQKHDFQDSKNTLENWCKTYRKQIVGIGECGLDFHYSTEFKNQQYEFLKMQLNLAVAFNLPLMLHVRDAHDEIVNFLKKYSLKIPVIFHCFSQDERIAKLILYELNHLDIYFSIPGIITFKNATSAQEAVKQLPLERLLVESDAPWLAPTPFRGKTNQPSYVEYTIRQIGLLKKIDPETVATITFNNACKIFLKR